MYPVDIVALGAVGLPAAHVEGDDGDPDALGGLLVHVRQLQPRMVPLLPLAEGVLRLVRRV